MLYFKGRVTFSYFDRSANMKPYIQLNRIIYLVLFGTLSFSCVNDIQIEAPVSLRYDIKPIHADSAEYLQFQIPLKTDQNGKLILWFQNNAWGQENLFNSISKLETNSSQSDIKMEADSNRIIITDEAHKELLISYDLISDMQGPLDFTRSFRTIVEDGYFHSFGGRLFMIPANIWNEDKPVNFEFNWNTPNRDYIIHNSFGASIKQDLQLNEEQFESSVFVGGDFKRYKHNGKDQTFYFLTRGDWIPFKEDSLFNTLQKINRGHRAFWQDYSDPYYSVTLIPTEEQNGYSVSGTGLTNSFASFITNNDKVEWWRVQYLFYHELLHQWTGQKIKNANEEEQYWFSEGFTDYYTFKLMLKDDIIDLKKFVVLMNEEIELLYQSPVRNISNDSMYYENFWSNPHLQDLPYKRGKIYAFHLDNQIRAESDKSLDDVMRTILEKCDDTGKYLSHDFFLEILRSYVTEEPKKDFDNYIQNGLDVPIERHLPTGLSFDKNASSNYLSIEDQNVKEVLIK